MHKHARVLAFALDSPKLWSVLFIVSAVLATADAGPQTSQPPNCIVGTLNAPVRLEVFSDFQCPACRTFYLDVVTQVVKNYGFSGKICILYHEFPLDMHPYGRKAARYSLAAQRLGRMQWLAVVDALYKRQPQWALDGGIEASLIGTVSAEDLLRMRSIALEPAIEETIAREIALGLSKQVKATPTVFVTAQNKEQKIEHLLPYQTWKNFFDMAAK